MLARVRAVPAAPLKPTLEVPSRARNAHRPRRCGGSRRRKKKRQAAQYFHQVQQAQLSRLLRRVVAGQVPLFSAGLLVVATLNKSPLQRITMHPGAADGDKIPMRRWGTPQLGWRWFSATSVPRLELCALAKASDQRITPHVWPRRQQASSQSGERTLLVIRRRRGRRSDCSGPRSQAHPGVTAEALPTLSDLRRDNY